MPSLGFFLRAVSVLLAVAPGIVANRDRPWQRGDASDVIQFDEDPWFNVTTDLHGGVEGRAAKDFWLRVMPLGASITQGIASSDQNGYRKHIRDQLRFAGWKVNMVGSKKDGTNFKDWDNEGHPGWMIDGVRTDAFRPSAWMKPNVILLNVGTNDCGNNNDPANAPARMKTLVDEIFASIPETTLLLSTILPSRAVDSCVQMVNTGYRSLVASYAQDSTKRIVLADMYAFLTQSDLSSDGVHPTDYGYEKMAAVWWDAFKKIEDRIQTPDPVIDDANDMTVTTCPKVAGNGRGPIQTQQGSGYDNGNYVHSSQGKGTVITLADGGDWDEEVHSIHFAQLINHGADRGGELDDMVRTYSNGNGTYTYGYRENSGGAFPSTWTTFNPGLTCGTGTVHIFADLNNDGLDDVWCIGPNAQASVAINLGTIPPTFRDIGMVMSPPAGGYGSSDVRIADIDGDGRADYCIVMANGNIQCWRNGGMGDAVAYWQGFSSENSGGDVVFTGKGKGNAAAVRLADLNGDFRADWMWIGDTGSVDTYINQRGSGVGIIPSWIDTGTTHAGMNTAAVWKQIKFGRIYGSGRLDYIYLAKNGDNMDVNIWQNTGTGGTKLKGDGVFYCDMRGTGSDDYVWIWEDGHAAEIYENTHSPPTWTVGTKELFNINRNRKSVFLADWDGDGRCDVLSQRKSDGALEMWRNDFDASTHTWKFTYLGFVNGAATCNQGWGVGLFDRGMRIADIDGDGRADYLCLEKDGRVTGWLNKAGGMENVGQIKFSEGWDRANMRFADVEDRGRADLLWINKYTGAVTVFENKGQIPASGSSFTWQNRSILYSSVNERGANMNFANLGGLGRADLMQVLPVTNEAYTWFNECPNTGSGGDDGPIVDPQLPPYSST